MIEAIISQSPHNPQKYPPVQKEETIFVGDLEQLIIWANAMVRSPF